MESINRDRAVPDADLATPSRALFFTDSLYPLGSIDSAVSTDATRRSDLHPGGRGIMYILTLVTRRACSCPDKRDFLFFSESSNFSFLPAK